VESDTYNSAALKHPADHPADMQDTFYLSESTCCARHTSPRSDPQLWTRPRRAIVAPCRVLRRVCGGCHPLAVFHRWRC